MNSHFIPALLFAFALSIDGFAACFAYGAAKIRIPFSSMLVLSLVSAFTLFLSLLAGTGLERLLPLSVGPWIRSILLLTLGLYKLIERPDSENPDTHSKLSPLEALPLGVSLSLDSAAAGIGAGAGSFPVFLTAILAFFTNLQAVWLGDFLGRHISGHISLNLSWLCGLVFIGLALLSF